MQPYTHVHLFDSRCFHHSQFFQKLARLTDIFGAVDEDNYVTDLDLLQVFI